MKKMRILIIFASLGILFPGAACQKKNPVSVTVPFILDHNRMLVEAEIQRNDGSWRKVRLWVDSGNPNFFLSEALARDLGIDLAGAGNSNLDVPPPAGVRIGGMQLNFEGVKSTVMFQPFWLFSATHNDANLPATVLKKYQIVLDYPQQQLTIAAPGSLKPCGTPSPAHVHPHTGIVQIDAFIAGDSLSFALDNGAAYSFISAEKLVPYSDSHPDWLQMTGTLGCANMWGWWPSRESTFPVVRLPVIQWGPVQLSQVGLVGVPPFSPNGPTLGAWYSQKTARPVDGFLGTNAFKAFRIEIDYGNSFVYFEKNAATDTTEMDLVGLAVRPLADSTYQIIGVAQKDGKLAVAGVEPGDLLLSIGKFSTRGATMGTVVDALRGKPGARRSLLLARNGKQFRIEAKVEHFL